MNASLLNTLLLVAILGVVLKLALSHHPRAIMDRVSLSWRASTKRCARIAKSGGN